MHLDNQVLMPQLHRLGPPSQLIDCPVVHLVMREGLGSVFQSMVLTPLARLREREIDTRLAVFCPVGEFFRPHLYKKWQQCIKSARRTYYRPIHRLVSPPARARRLWSEAWALKRWIMWSIGADRHAILHCRGTEAADAALQIRRHLPKLKVIFDMRGLADAEYFYERGLSRSDAEYHRLGQIQYRAVQNADAIFCVSHAMADHAVGSLAARREKITVLRCAVPLVHSQRLEMDRLLMRRKLGLCDRFVVAFNGGCQKWQRPEQAANAFRIIKHLRPDAHFLVMTLDADRMGRVLQSAGVPPADATILSVSHSQVAEHLAGADLGLLLRDRSIVNAVASPVKFAEFLACGVPVAISGGLGDYSALVEQNRIGVVLDEDEPETVKALQEFLVTYDRDHLRDECRKAVLEELNLEANIDRTLHVYSQLCTESCESCT